VSPTQANIVAIFLTGCATPSRLGRLQDYGHFRTIVVGSARAKPKKRLLILERVFCALFSRSYIKKV
jgi:hypothetical protein